MHHDDHGDHHDDHYNRHDRDRRHERLATQGPCVAALPAYLQEISQGAVVLHDLARAIGARPLSRPRRLLGTVSPLAMRPPADYEETSKRLPEDRPGDLPESGPNDPQCFPW